MQTFTQVFAGAQTWQLNVPGNYFILIGATNVVNIRFYKQGKQLSLGSITGVLPGLQAGPFRDTKADGIAFDRVEIDTTAADTITLGIGDGSVTYQRSQGSVLVTSGVINIQDKNGNSIDSAPSTGIITTAMRDLVVQDAGAAYGASFQSNTNIASATNEQAVSAATNVNGLIIANAGMVDRANAVGVLVNTSLLAKATAPASGIDGDLLFTNQSIEVTAMSGQASVKTLLPGRIQVPSGKGVHFFCINAQQNALKWLNYIAK